MEYEKGYVYKLMDQGGPTDVRESYFKEASEEMIRARRLCQLANETPIDNPEYVKHLEELFNRKLDGIRILTPFICDFGNRVKFGKNVFINHQLASPKPLKNNCVDTRFLSQISTFSLF